MYFHTTWQAVFSKHKSNSEQNDAMCFAVTNINETYRQQTPKKQLGEICWKQLLSACHIQETVYYALGILTVELFLGEYSNCTISRQMQHGVIVECWNWELVD